MLRITNEKTSLMQSPSLARVTDEIAARENWQKFKEICV